MMIVCLNTFTVHVTHLDCVSPYRCCIIKWSFTSLSMRQMLELAQARKEEGQEAGVGAVSK